MAGDRALVGAPATERDGVGAAYVFSGPDDDGAGDGDGSGSGGDGEDDAGGDSGDDGTDDVSENDDGTVSVSDVTGPAPDIADEVAYLGDRFLVTGEVVDLTLDPGEPETDVDVYLDEERVAPAEPLD